MRRHKHLPAALQIVGFVATAAGAAVFLAMGGGNYNWQWYRVPVFLVQVTESGVRPGLLLQGLFVTLKISAAGLAASFVVGLTAALFRISRSFTARLVARVYLEAVRNTPLLIQLFFIYFVVSPIFGFGSFFSAILALSLFEGAYASEIIRGGISSIHPGQWESAYSLGLNAPDTYLHVILPQAFRRILPPLAGQTVSLVKDSALVSTIAIYDLSMQGQAAVSRTFLTFEIWFTVAAIYLVVTGSLSFLSRFLEKKLKGHPV